MASGGFTRAALREILGEAYTDDIGTRLVTAHRAELDPVKDERDSARAEAAKYKTAAEKVPGLQQELYDLKGEDWKGKYESEKKAHDDYKAQVARDAQEAKVKAAYRKLLTDERISEKTLEAVLNATDYSGMKLKDDGTLDGVEDLKKDIDTKWGGFRVSTRQRGERVDNPPHGGNGRMTREEIMGIKDASARQRAIAENLDLFQKG